VLVAGVDVGSTATKAAVVGEDRRVLGRGLVSTGANVVRAAESAFRQALEAAGNEEWEISHTVGTGYGRYRVPFGNSQVTEIACHAKGAHYFFPDTRTIIDIGGQDTKGIRVGASGEVLDFVMNDKCAAGTGRFLDAAATTLGIGIDEIGPLSLRAQLQLRITNVCAVFVESEIMSHLAKGRRVDDILRGVHLAIAGRSIALVRRIGIENEVTFTGGVSRNPGMVSAIEEKLSTRLNVSPDSQFTGAIGAALFALEKVEHDVRAGH